MLLVISTLNVLFGCQCTGKLQTEEMRRGCRQRCRPRVEDTYSKYDSLESVLQHESTVIPKPAKKNNYVDIDMYPQWKSVEPVLITGCLFSILLGTLVKQLNPSICHRLSTVFCHMIGIIFQAQTLYNRTYLGVNDFIIDDAALECVCRFDFPKWRPRLNNKRTIYWPWRNLCKQSQTM